MVRSGKPVPIPPIDGVEYLAEYLIELNFSMAGPMGATPITWGELTAWRDLSKRPIKPWEATALIEASRAFLSVQSAVDGETVPAPWGDEKEERRKKVADTLRAGFAQLMN